jgi:hypothetical protein
MLLLPSLHFSHIFPFPYFCASYRHSSPHRVTLAEDGSNGFSDFVHRPDSKELEDKNITFRKLDVFPSSDEGAPTLLGPLERANLNQWTQQSRRLPSPEDENRSRFRNVVFLSSNSLESGRWTKSENPLILCVIHHRPNPIESTGRRRFRLSPCPCKAQCAFLESDKYDIFICKCFGCYF